MGKRAAVQGRAFALVHAYAAIMHQYGKPQKFEGLNEKADPIIQIRLGNYLN